jgi:hypothetical protein
LELTWDERKSWLSVALVAATGLAVSLLHMPLLPVLAIFGGAGILGEWRRARKGSAA